MDGLTEAFGEPELLVFPYSTDLEQGGDWMDLDPVDHSMPFINIHRRTDGIHGVRIKYDNTDDTSRIGRIVELDVFIDKELVSPVLELIAAQALTAVFGWRNEVVIL